VTDAAPPSPSPPPGTLLATAEAPGKAILLGEHAVVYGHPALAGALGRGVRVTVRADPQGPRLHPGPLAAPVPIREGDGGALGTALARVLADVAPGLRQVALVAEGSLPLGSGLGSSAALSVACARALAQTAGAPLSPDRLYDVVRHAEEVFHGNPSGVDQATVVRGGVLLFRRASTEPGARPHVTPVTPARPLHLVVAMLRPHTGTREAVAALRERRDRHPRTVDGLMAELGALALDGARALESGCPGRLGELMDLSHGILAALGVSSDDLDHLVHLARRAGALGAKLTGAGVGGAIIALPGQAPDAAQRILDAMTTVGAVAFLARVGEPPTGSPG
jgi:mevalonate kinase